MDAITEQKTCPHELKNGAPCPNPVMPGFDHCSVHGSLLKLSTTKVLAISMGKTGAKANANLIYNRLLTPSVVTVRDAINGATNTSLQNLSAILIHGLGLTQDELLELKIGDLFEIVKEHSSR